MKRGPGTKGFLLWPFLLHLQPGPAGPGRLLLPAAALSGLILPFFLEPGAAGLGTHTRLFIAPCLFHRLTGLPCPLCGMTTSLSLLARGRFPASLLAHPLGWLAFLYLLAFAAIPVWAAATRRAASVSLRATPAQLITAILFLWGLRLAAWSLSGG